VDKDACGKNRRHLFCIKRISRQRLPPVAESSLISIINTAMLNRSQKENIISELADKLKNSKSVVFSDYSGTSVSKLTQLRKELRGQDIAFKITKKKLFDIALKNSGIDASTANLEGQIGMAIGAKDEISAAKILTRFSRENPNFKVLSGIVEKKEISAEDVRQLASLPGREELLAKLAATLNASVTGFVNVLAGNIRGLVQVLKGIADTKQ